MPLRDIVKRVFPDRQIALRRLYELLTVPISIWFLTDSQRIHHSYRMGPLKRFRLGLRMFFNTVRIPSGSSYKGHLAMALKLFEMSPEIEGVVLECGTYKGASAANISLICKITGRRLKIFDSFEGLPEPMQNDREGVHYSQGDYAGTLPEVQRNIRKYGNIECCDFVPGWFDATLPELKESVVLAWIDVDLEASLETCIRCIWPHLVEEGYTFIDEGVGTDYAALFWSEKWWKDNFDRTPPGLIGSGTGLGLGNYYLGPVEHLDSHPLWHAGTCAYTMKSMSGYWSYYPKAGDSEKG